MGMDERRMGGGRLEGETACPWARRFERLLSGFVDGELCWPARLRVRRHLAHCPDCRAVVQSLQTVSAAVGSVPRPSVGPERLEAYVAEVLARVGEGSAVPVARRGSPCVPRLAWAVASACALVAIVTVGIRSTRTPAELPLARLESVEMADYPVMSYRSPETGVTVVWALGFGEGADADRAGKGAG